MSYLTKRIKSENGKVPRGSPTRINFGQVERVKFKPERIKFNPRRMTPSEIVREFDGL